MDVYVVDTGINIAHIEFEGRAKWGTTFVRGNAAQDGNGHGTHVAGTIASRAYGVAKAAHVYAVQVMDANGSGALSDVIAGVDWVVQQAKDKAAAAQQEFALTGKTSNKGSVINLSVGGPPSKAVDAAVNGAVDAGVHVAVAAGAFYAL